MNTRRQLVRKLILIAPATLLAFLFQNCSPMQSFKTVDMGSSQTDFGSSSGSGSGSQPQPGSGLPPYPPPVGIGGKVTDFQVTNTGPSDQTNAPFTLGEVFIPGALLKTETLVGKLEDGTLIPLQFEVKATHRDGSIRHAIISAALPQIAAGATHTISLLKAANSSSAGNGQDPSSLLAAGFGARVDINLGGTTYSASAEDLLRSGHYQNWLSGFLTNEWLVTMPLTTSAGVAHPHLTASFAIRSYTGLNKAKVDVVVENDWAYEAAPQNFTYDVQIAVGGKNVYSKTALTHFRQSRWKKSFWWGVAPSLAIRHNTKDLILSRAVPNYDPNVVISEPTLAGYQSRWTGTAIEPMQSGIAAAYMPTTGGRGDIGILPEWSVSYLLTQDPRAKQVTLGMGDLAGGWPMHFRDQKTGHPMTIKDYPYSTLLGNPGDTYNPATKAYESFPNCAGDCSSTLTPDTSHHPSLAYLPYLVTGDFYYLEELQFWAMYGVIEANPYYRQFGQGLVISNQIRGQAWTLRTLGDASYITPDSDPLKTQLNQLVLNNLTWFDQNYTNNAGANVLGALTNGDAFAYNNGTGVAPWQDDFFTQAIGHLVDLGFTEAQNFLAYKTKFVIGRLTAPGYCWISAPIYSMNIRASSTSPIYGTFAEAYQNSVDASFLSLTCGGSDMASKLNLSVGEMTGYSSSGMGYPSNMQPAVAYAATSGASNGPAAWDVFMKRSVLPDYTTGAQFAIVPRK